MVLTSRSRIRSWVTITVCTVFVSNGPVRAEERDLTQPAGPSEASPTSLSLHFAVADAAQSGKAEGTEPTDKGNGCFEKWLSGDWGGHRTAWEEEGVKLSFIQTTGFFQNFRGGLETHNANAISGDWRMNFYFDLDKLGLISDAFFFIRGKSGWNNGVQADVGSLGPEQWVYGSTGDEEFYIDKWWYGQRFLDDRLEFRIGKLLTPADLFDIPVYAKWPWDHFSNAALGRNPTVPHRKAMGAYLKVKFTDWASFKMAAIDADQTDSTLPADLERALHGSANYVGLWELVVTPPIEGPNGKLPGNYAFGCWYDGRSKRKLRDELGGLLAPRYRSDDTGFYLAFDQLAWKENDDPADKQGLGAFMRYGFAHPETNRINHFWSLGAQYQGLLAGRDDDVLAFGVAQSIMSKTLRHNIDSRMDRETIYELYYAYQLTRSCIITPDLQLITNPGGSKDARDAVVAGVRVRLAF
jgi:porin